MERKLNGGRVRFPAEPRITPREMHEREFEFPDLDVMMQLNQYSIGRFAKARMQERRSSDVAPDAWTVRPSNNLYDGPDEIPEFKHGPASDARAVGKYV